MGVPFSRNLKKILIKEFYIHDLLKNSFFEGDTAGKNKKQFASRCY